MSNLKLHTPTQALDLIFEELSQVEEVTQAYSLEAIREAIDNEDDVQLKRTFTWWLGKTNPSERYSLMEAMSIIGIAWDWCDQFYKDFSEVCEKQNIPIEYGRETLKVTADEIRTPNLRLIQGGLSEKAEDDSE